MNRNTLIIALISSLVGIHSMAHAQTSVTWSFASHKIGPRTFEVHLIAAVAPGDWHIYSQSTPKGGPLPTSISFVNNPLVQLIGTPKEIGKMHQVFDDVFGVDIRYFKDSVDFVEEVELKANVKTQVSGSIKYMVCTDQECQTPAPELFKVSIGGD